jgi:membrane protein DedA with SNARE-associated domain
MDHLSINFIRHFVEINAVIAYILIIVGVIIEGEIVVILAGICSHLGSLNPFIALLAVIVGGSIKSFVGYSIGFYLQAKHSERPFLSSMEKRISYFLPHFKERQFSSIFISRFLILGVGWFTLIFSGYKKVPLKIYTRAEALSLGIWSVGFLALGSFFSYTALSMSRDVRNFLGIILIFFIAFFILERVIALFVELFERKDVKIEDKKEN